MKRIVKCVAGFFLSVIPLSFMMGNIDVTKGSQKEYLNKYPHLKEVFEKNRSFNRESEGKNCEGACARECDCGI